MKTKLEKSDIIFTITMLICILFISIAGFAFGFNQSQQNEIDTITRACPMTACPFNDNQLYIIDGNLYRSEVRSKDHVSKTGETYTTYSRIYKKVR